MIHEKKLENYHGRKNHLRREGRSPKNWKTATADDEPKEVAGEKDNSGPQPKDLPEAKSTAAGSGKGKWTNRKDVGEEPAPWKTERQRTRKSKDLYPEPEEGPSARTDEPASDLEVEELEDERPRSSEKNNQVKEIKLTRRSVQNRKTRNPSSSLGCNE